MAYGSAGTDCLRLFGIDGRTLSSACCQGPVLRVSRLVLCVCRVDLWQGLRRSQKLPFSCLLGLLRGWFCHLEVGHWLVKWGLVPLLGGARLDSVALGRTVLVSAGSGGTFMFTPESVTLA